MVVHAPLVCVWLHCDDPEQEVQTHFYAHRWGKINFLKTVCLKIGLKGSMAKKIRWGLKGSLENGPAVHSVRHNWTFVGHAIDV